MTPDNTLLALIPQDRGKWSLNRVAAWDTKSPREQSLSFDGDSSGDSDKWIVADLIVNPDGNYVVARVTSRQGAISPTGRNWEAVVVVVDISTFKIVLKRDTTDPLIAGSQWDFNKDAALIAKGLIRRMPADVNNIVTDTYESAVLSLPNLAPSLICNFNLEFKLGEMGQAVSEGGDNCTLLLKKTNATSLVNLPGHDSALDRVFGLTVPGCLFAAVTTTTKALYECTIGHAPWYDWDSFVVTSRSLAVVSTTDGQRVLTLAVPVKQPIAAAFGAAKGQSYLLLLRDGIKLEAYRLS